MNHIELIGWLGNFFFVAGAILLANKRKLGFYSNAFGNLLYVYFGFLIVKDSLIFLSIFLILVNLFGIYNWKIALEKKKERERLIKKLNKY